MPHGQTDSQIDTRIKAMGASVAVILKRLERDQRKRSADADATWNLDQSLLEKIRDARARLLFIEQDRDDFGFADESDIAAINEQIADLESERGELRQRMSKPPNWPDLADVRDWLASQRRTTKWQPSVPTIKIPPGSSAGEELTRIRAEVDAIRAAIRGAEIAWLPKEDAERKAIEQIDRLAITGAPDFRGLFRLSKPNPAVRRPQQGVIEWPKEVIGGDFYNAGFALTVWLHRDALVERAKQEIAALARPNALSVAEREEKIAALAVQLLEAERREEVAYLMAVKTDPSLQRRPVDMRAFLQIEEAPADPAEKSEAKESEFG